MNILPDPDFDRNTPWQPNPFDPRPGFGQSDFVSRPEAAQIAHLENQVRSQSRTISELETTIRSLEKANKDAISDANTKIAKRDQEIVLLTEKNSIQKKQLQILQEDIKSTKLLVAGLTRQVGSLEQQVTGSVSTLRTELSIGVGNVNQGIAELRDEQQAQTARTLRLEGRLRDSLAQADLRFQKAMDSLNQLDPLPKQRYLVRETNTIDLLLVQAKTVPSRNAAQYVKVATRAACEALTKLSHDRDFEMLVLDLAAATTERSREYRSHLQDLDSFRAFCEVDRKVLLKGGLSTNAVDQLLDLLKQLDGTALGLLRHGIHADEVFSAIDTVCEQTCDLSDQLESSSRIKDRLTTITRVGFLLIGASIVAINASNVVAHLGNDPSVGAVSQASGALVMQEAASGRLGLLRMLA